MDSLAARHAAQLGSVTMDLHCSVCASRGKATLGSTDCEDWKLRDAAVLREQAEKWKNATSVREQEDIFNQYGTRWSELWRLSYWKPTHQLVIDYMHCQLEGNAHNHFRNVLGLTMGSAHTKLETIPAFRHPFEKVDTRVPPLPDNMTEKEGKQVASIHALLTAPIEGVNEDGEVVDQTAFEDSWTDLSAKLLRKNMKPLEFVCRDLNSMPTNPYGGSKIYKKSFVNQLESWVRILSRHVDALTDCALQRRTKPYRPSGPPPLKIATPAVMQCIRDVIQHTVVPSWVNSVPKNFGEAAAGPLKADEWRTMCLIYLPLALIYLWGEGSVHPSADDAIQFRQILDHTMSLVSAILLASMHTMTRARSDAYLECMRDYVRRFGVLHPSENYKPNHHLSLHFPFFFTLFGPARVWWCFPFERLIGHIQRLLSNHKLGERFLFLGINVTDVTIYRTNGVNPTNITSQGDQTEALACESMSSAHIQRGQEDF